jgi:hypothetical protein
VISARERWRPEDGKFEDSLNYIMSTCLSEEERRGGGAGEGEKKVRKQCFPRNPKHTSSLVLLARAISVANLSLKK